MLPVLSQFLRNKKLSLEKNTAAIFRGKKNLILFGKSEKKVEF